MLRLSHEPGTHRPATRERLVRRREHGRTFAAAVVATIASIATACAPASAARAAAEPTGVTIFADEFSGAAIDRERWEVYTGPVYNTELQAYVDDAATMRIVRGAESMGAEDGAALLIEARRRPDSVARPTGAGSAGPRAEFVSGRLHARGSFTHGTVAARMRLPAGAGLWPAFWLLGTGSWPDHGEIDIMENVGDPRWVSVALHGPGYSGDTPLVARDTLPPGSDATAWHVYQADWLRDSIVFRVDGRAIYTVTRAGIERYGKAAALDSAKYVVLNLAIGGGYPSAVNGIREPRLGLPDSSVARIRRGEARVLVDWVRWTR